LRQRSFPLTTTPLMSNESPSPSPAEQPAVDVQATQSPPPQAPENPSPAETAPPPADEAPAAKPFVPRMKIGSERGPQQQFRRGPSGGTPAAAGQPGGGSARREKGAHPPRPRQDEADEQDLTAEAREAEVALPPS